jgi:hypothetical protein
MSAGAADERVRDHGCHSTGRENPARLMIWMLRAPETERE